MEPRITLNGERKSAAQHRGLTTSSCGSSFCLLLAIRPGTSELSEPPLSHLCTGGTRSAPSLRRSRARKAGARGVQGGWAQPGLDRGASAPAAHPLPAVSLRFRTSLCLRGEAPSCPPFLPPLNVRDPRAVELLGPQLFLWHERSQIAVSWGVGRGGLAENQDVRWQTPCQLCDMQLRNTGEEEPTSVRS